MKKLLTILAILFSATCFGQEFKIGKVEKAIALLKGDTLIISYSPQVKFIKIGDNVYEIKSPTIEKVETNGGLYFRNGTIGNPNMLNIPGNLRANKP